MNVLWWAWAISAGVLVALGIAAGHAVNGTALGVLIDERGRYSLARLHVVWWSLIILSMASGVAAARFTAKGARPLGFDIPKPVLALMITVGSTTLVSSVVKAHHDLHRSTAVTASLPGDAFLGQLLLQEEGTGADKSLDVGKLQSLVLTILLGIGYVTTACYMFIGRDKPPITRPDQLVALPSLDATFVALLAISSTSYVATKLIPRGGPAPFSVAERDARRRNAIAATKHASEPVDGTPTPAYATTSDSTNAAL